MSQYGWKTQEKIQSVIDGYRDRKIPLDVVVQDAEYWPLYPDNFWGSHLFDSARYSNPKAMVEHIHDQHAHTIISVWPRINKGTDVYDMHECEGIFARAPEHRDEHERRGHSSKRYRPTPPMIRSIQSARKLFWHFHE